MRRLFRLRSVVVLASALLGAGCDSTDFTLDPLIATDTVTIGVPDASAVLPTALDITAAGGGIGGGRFPERIEDAEQYDFVLRRRDGALALVPGGQVGLVGPGGTEFRAAITRALSGRTFPSVERAPDREEFAAEAVRLDQGGVYVARSRIISCGLFGADSQYAKLQPLALDVSEGTVTLQVVTNGRCGDVRLVPED